MTQAWSAYVELAVHDTGEDTVDALYETLAGHHPSIGHAPNGNLAVQITTEAGTARQALAAAMRTVTEAAAASGLPQTVSGVELVTEEELERRLQKPAVPELVGVAELAQLWGVNRSRAGQYTQMPGFPAPVAILRAGPVFVLEQVQRWKADRGLKAGRPPKPVPLTDMERELLSALDQLARLGAGVGELGGVGRRAADAIAALTVASGGDRVRVEVTGEPGRLRLLGEAAGRGQMRQALDTLVAHRLVRRPRRPAGEMGVLVELTRRGARIAG
jgi:hypothetical protein